MSRTSDSDVDLAKYMPTVEASLRLADNDAAEERVRRALEDPELQAVLAAQGRSVEFTPVPPQPATPRADDRAPQGVARALARHEAGVIDPRSIEKVRRMADAADAAKGSKPAALKNASAPSPWATKAPAAEIDDSALPSATVRPVPEKKPQATERRSAERRLPMWTIWAAAGTIAAVLVVLMLARSLSLQPREVSVPATGTAGTSATPSAPSAQASVATSATSDVAPALPAVSTSPSTAPTQDPPRAPATTGAAVPPAARPSSPSPKPHHAGDPPQSPPQAPVTATPTPTAIPGAPPTPPPSATSPKPRDPFLLEKKDE